MHREMNGVVCSVLPRSYKEDNWGNQVNSVWESEEKNQLERSDDSGRT
jgi:hypothetical protein